MSPGDPPQCPRSPPARPSARPSAHWLSSCACPRVLGRGHWVEGGLRPAGHRLSSGTDGQRHQRVLQAHEPCRVWGTPQGVQTQGARGGGRRPGCAQLVAPGAGTLLPAADPARGQEGPLLGEGPPHCARRVGSAEQGSLPPGVPASGAVWTVTAPLQSPWMRVLSITIMWMGCEDGLLWGGAPPLVIDSRSH